MDYYIGIGRHVPGRANTALPVTNQRGSPLAPISFLCSCILDEAFKRRAGRQGNPRSFLWRRRPTAHEFQFEALFPHAHGPAVIGRKNRLQHEGEDTE
jgi:hypothetical protein